MINKIPNFLPNVEKLKIKILFLSEMQVIMVNSMDLYLRKIFQTTLQNKKLISSLQV